MDLQEVIFNDSSKLLLMPIKESSNLAEALRKLPGLRKLVQEYYWLINLEKLSDADAERMSAIFELAEYDKRLNECIDKIDESIMIVEQLETNNFSIEDFIERVECIPSQEMTLEKFKELAQQLHLSDDFLTKFIGFKDNHYHRKLILQTSFGCIYAIGWKPGQNTTIHPHCDDISVIRVYQGTLTYRLYKEVNHLYGEKVYRPIPIDGNRIESQVKENDWVCVDFSQIHQLANESNQNLVTLHFRYFKNPIEDEFSLPGCEQSKTKKNSINNQECIT